MEALNSSFTGTATVSVKNNKKNNSIHFIFSLSVNFYILKTMKTSYNTVQGVHCYVSYKGNIFSSEQLRIKLLDDHRKKLDK